MTSQRGFTLVELSIVLVILGLLIGGVLTGQSMIRAAELRSVSTQYQRYITAVQTFRDKYFALPGDMTNATAYWGIAAGSTGNDSTCFNASVTTTATCNGDGDGKIQTTVSATAQQIADSWRFWKHLANAGLIEGNYNGYGGSNGITQTNLNSPAGRISSSLWLASNQGQSSGSAVIFDGQYDNVLVLGAPIASFYAENPILKPEESYNIDTKMDDGMPATGKIVIAAINGLNTCTSTNSSSTITAIYLLTSPTIACAPVFRQQF